MSSLINGDQPGLTGQNSRKERKPISMTVESQGCLLRYGIIAHTFSITETENVAVTPSIGDKLFVYCTNSAPVQIYIKGAIGSNGLKKFSDFYADYRVGKAGKILKTEINGTTYKAILTSYSREYTSTPSPLDNCTITLLAVRV